jgi:transposase-like protein
MQREHTYHPAPCCPSCGAAMRPVRSIPRIGGLPELQSFECRACGISITEALEPKVSETSWTVGRFS